MKTFIFKTNINSRYEVDEIKPLLNNQPIISRWSVDMQDVDRVLKIVTKEDTCEHVFIDLVTSRGYACEELPD